MRIGESVRKVFGKLMKRRITLLLLAGAVFMVFVLIFVFGFVRNSFNVANEKETRLGLDRFRIEIPRGAFSRPRDLKIVRLSPEEKNRLAPQLLGDVYRVVFLDGAEEFSLKPIRLKYYVDRKYVQGANYNNLAIAQLSNEGGFRVLSGSMIGRDEKGYFVEAYTYHLTAFGVILKKSSFQEHGLKILREAIGSPAPALLVIPGEDPTFEGQIGEKNVWEEVFQDRTVAVYKYALYDSRSFVYSEMFREFVQREGRRSFIDFEADFLARELEKYERYEFDIIAHGTGGLIVLRALQRNPNVKNVRRVVLFSTPVGGTNLVNPLYFSSVFFGKDPKLLEEVFGLDWGRLKMLSLHVYNLIETLGEVATEVLPGSQIVRELEKFDRTDIKIFSICGNTPPYDLNVEGTELERFYPEMVAGKGDGFVSVERCKIGSTFIFQGSFYDIYLRKENVERVLQLLSYEVANFPGFKDDSYLERLGRENPERFTLVVPKTSKETEARRNETSVFKIFRSNFLKKTTDLNLFSYKQGAVLGETVFIVSDEGLMRWNDLILKGSVSFLKKNSDHITFVSGEEVFSIDEVGIRKTGLTVRIGYVPADVLALKEGILVSRIAPGGIRYSVLRRNEEFPVTTSVGSRVQTKVSGDRILLLSEKELVVLNMDFSVSKRYLNTFFVEGEVAILDACFEGNDLLVLMENGHLVRLREEKVVERITLPSVDRFWKLIPLSGDCILVGDKSVLSKKGALQVFESIVIDAFGEGKTLVLVFDEGIRKRVGVFEVGESS